MSTPETVVTGDRVIVEEEPAAPAFPKVKWAVFSHGEVRAVEAHETRESLNAVVLLDSPPGTEDIKGIVLDASSPEEMIEAKRGERLTALDSLRDAMYFDAFPFEEEWVQCNQRSRNAIDAFQLAVTSGKDPFPYKWRLASDEWYPLPDRDAWGAIMDEYYDYSTRIWTVYAEHEELLLITSTPDTYDITGRDWPVSRIDPSTF